MQKPVVSEIPRGVGAPPPPGMDLRKGKGKLMCIKVRMLDDSVAVFHLGHKATGQALFDEVCRHLNLLECDYFGLEFIDGYDNRCWLEKDKSILRQITATQSDARFYFICKFYTPNPADLEEEYTRYLLCLQIRRDLAYGELICNENTTALLVSFIVQAECGDFSADDYPDHTYLSMTNFVPNQTAAFQIKVMENHKKLIGMGPADADLALLETARRCDFYGIKLHAAKDIEGTEVMLSVAHMGIKVFHQLNCISTFSWAKIRKLSFKRRHLMIKLHPESYQYYKETIEFNFENRNECKNFWKKCVEHHAFFRCLDAPNFKAPINAYKKPTLTDGGITAASKKETKRLFSHGSSFRYHGRTQKQLIDYVREHRKRREPFQRPIRASSNRNDADPYGAIANASTRQAQFNIIDPMLVSTTSTVMENTGIKPMVPNCSCRVGGGGGGGGGGVADKCCPHQHNYLHLMNIQQQQQQQKQRHHQQQLQYVQYPWAGPTPGPSSTDDIVKYSEVYHPQRPYQQQQQHYHHHYPGQGQVNIQHQHHCQHHRHQQFHDQQQQDYYRNIPNEPSSRRQRPKSVFAGNHNGGCTAEYNAVASSKNYNSSGDVTSMNVKNFCCKGKDGRREGSGPPLASNSESIEIQKTENYNQQQAVATATDQMSTSLPNVLAEDLKVLCQEYRIEQNTSNSKTPGFFNNPPPKSMSGDNFINDIDNDPGVSHGRGRAGRDAVSDFIYDRMSEGSYRLTDFATSAQLGADGNSSSQSDVGTSNVDTARVLSTTFTTKRVGNVIVKRVIDPKDRHKNSTSKDVDDDEESLSSYSESFCKLSHVSAPASYSARSQPSQPQPQQLRQRLRNAVPIPIDNPPEGGHGLYRPSPPRQQIPADSNWKPHSAAATTDQQFTVKSILKSNETTKSETSAPPTTTIIRPVLIDSTENRPSSVLTRTRPTVVTPLSMRNPGIGMEWKATNNASSSSSSTFSTSTIVGKTIPTTISQQLTTTPLGNTSNNKPIVHGIKYPKPVSPDANNQLDNSPSQNQEVSEQQQQQTTITKGIPGRIISKKNMVITPEGILPKEEVIGNRNKKPKVPPKPKLNQYSTVTTTVASAVENENLMQDMKKEDVQNNVLLSSKVIADKTKESVQIDASSPQQQIHVSIQSEDQPQVQRLHMFGQIPYTLTMRNVGTPTTGAAAANAKEVTMSSTSTFQLMRKGNFDLVDRKQLPSQSSFSSQDHSISPTTPDSGNIVEYIMRKRSLSSERFADSPEAKTTTNRRERRRQTQPIRLGKTALMQKDANRPSGTETQNIGEAKKALETFSSPLQQSKSEYHVIATDDDSIDLPEPPPSVMQAEKAMKDINNKRPSESNEVAELAEKIVSGILETDF